jgi:hypothetical protein
MSIASMVNTEYNDEKQYLDRLLILPSEVEALLDQIVEDGSDSGSKLAFIFMTIHDGIDGTEENTIRARETLGFLVELLYLKSKPYATNLGSFMEAARSLEAEGLLLTVKPKEQAAKSSKARSSKKGGK